jgi:two-component system sensor histidine kinase KdpD
MCNHVKCAALTAGVIAAVSYLSVVLFSAAALPDTDIVLLYCLAVIVIAWRTHSFVYSLAATAMATASYNFFFADPYYSFNIYDTTYIYTFIALSIAALLASWLTLNARRSALTARLKEEEIEKERYHTNLLRSISHDIRTPLSAIIGTAEMLEGGTEPGDSRLKLIRGIRDEADWLRSLVENILNLTRLGEGSLEKKPEAAEEVVGGAISHISRRSPGHRITVDMPEELLFVPMEAKLIEQVLINLLDNAARYTVPEGGISVVVKEGAGAAEFSVMDEGSGIDGEHLPNIFQTFYTTREKQADSGFGSGLGLAICKTIVEAHGGTITARNRIGQKGAEFIFTLPLEEERNKA